MQTCTKGQQTDWRVHATYMHCNSHTYKQHLGQFHCETPCLPMMQSGYNANSDKEDRGCRSVDYKIGIWKREEDKREKGDRHRRYSLIYRLTSRAASERPEEGKERGRPATANSAKDRSGLIKNRAAAAAEIDGGRKS